MNKSSNYKIGSVSPVRISQWIMDRLISDTDPAIQYLMYSKNLTPDQLELLYKTRLRQLKAQSSIRNIAELYGEEDEVSSLRFSSYDAKTYLDTVINQVLSHFSNHSVSISLKGVGTCKNVVFDIRRTNIILFNLISNSIIHSKNKHKVVELEAYMRGDDFVVSVRDDGKPISATQRKTLFSAYEAIPDKTLVLSSDLLELKGLGLSVCRKLAREMDGDVIYIPSSTVNRFELFIPQANTRNLLFESISYIPNFSDSEIYLASAILSLIEP